MKPAFAAEATRTATGPLTATPMVFAERDGKPVGWVWQTHEGATAIRTIVDAPAVRQGFERRLISGVDFGVREYDRSHSQGPGTGVESARGILLAPQEVNRVLQNAGIESLIREIYRQKKEGTVVYLTTETLPHEQSPMLKRIGYRVEAEQEGKRGILFEAAIEVGRPRENGTREPRVSMEAERWGFDHLDSYLKAPAEIRKLSEAAERRAEGRARSQKVAPAETRERPGSERRAGRR